MSQAELGRHYLVEITARAITVQHRCDALLSYDYFSESPRILARTVQRVASYLTVAAKAIFDEIDWDATPDEIAKDFRLLRLTDKILQELAQQLRYVEGARTERIPWSIVPSFEALVRRILPDVQIMLRAMWHYNYAFHLQDQRIFFHRVLAEHEDYVPAIDLDNEVLCDMRRPFHIISFPSLEQKHILLHSLLGHEVGHLLVERFLTDIREAAFASSTKAEIEAVTDRQVAEIPASYGVEVRKFFRDQLLSQNTRTALTLWRRALEEILSDLCGACLFGPATLFATLEMAMQAGYDVPPSAATQYYPPWRMRLRHVMNLLETQGGWFPIPVTLFQDDGNRAAKVERRVSLIRDLVSDRRDEAALRMDPLATIAYREAESHLRSGITFLLESCGLAAARPVATRLYEALPVLISRLDQSVPPNAFESTIADTRVATFVEILNASWYHRVSVDTTGDLTEAAETRNRLNNLALKAIEYSQLATDYSAWLAAQPPPD